MPPLPPSARLNSSGAVTSHELSHCLTLPEVGITKVLRLVSNKPLVTALATTKLSAIPNTLIFGLLLRRGWLALVVVVLRLRLVDWNRPFFALVAML